MCVMRSVGLKTLKNKLSEYVRLAAGGETVLVTNHERVVAELVAPRADRSPLLPTLCSRRRFEMAGSRPRPLRREASQVVRRLPLFMCYSASSLTIGRSASGLLGYLSGSARACPRARAVPGTDSNARCCPPVLARVSASRTAAIRSPRHLRRPNANRRTQDAHSDVSTRLKPTTGSQVSEPGNFLGANAPSRPAPNR
jgi:antitoxin (DNA-binding transcriptional repressor) of toxin-antitoxin stability system